MTIHSSPGKIETVCETIATGSGGLFPSKVFQKATRLLLAKNAPRQELKECRSSLSKDEANQKIRDLCSANAGGMVARFGFVELGALLLYEKCRDLGFRGSVLDWLCGGNFLFSESTFSTLRQNAGFFPITRKSLDFFYQEMLSAMREVDVLGSWVKGESRFENQLANASLCQLRDLEPYYHESPWSAALEGKRVLVIHPFTESIKRQYEAHREHLFPGTRVLPEFDLSCLQAVQSIAGNHPEHPSWQAGLDWMTNEALKKSCDVALIGCGAYGFPLAARLKRLGNMKAIHMGGSTQILFGIKGVRWDSHPTISKLYNEHWTRPSEAERPEKAATIEGGAYW